MGRLLCILQLSESFLITLLNIRFTTLFSISDNFPKVRAEPAHLCLLCQQCSTKSRRHYIFYIFYHYFVIQFVSIFRKIFSVMYQLMHTMNISGNMYSNCIYAIVTNVLNFFRFTYLQYKNLSFFNEINCFL